MAILQVTLELIAELLFKGLNVEIHNARMDFTATYLELSIRGEDVPDCENVTCICTQYREPGTDPHVKIEIKPA